VCGQEQLATVTAAGVAAATRPYGGIHVLDDDGDVIDDLEDGDVDEAACASRDPDLTASARRRRT
jgi:hypothetical protein